LRCSGYRCEAIVKTLAEMMSSLLFDNGKRYDIETLI
jgi:hypothetical protein